MLKEKAFENGFVKEFGQPSANQSWDFYAQKLQSVRDAKTRATMAEPITCNVGTLQTNQTLSESMQAMLDSVLTVVPEQRYNYTAGQHDYHLYSVGEFKISAVRYAGGIEIIRRYNFDFGLVYKDENGVEQPPVNLFGYHNMGGEEQSNFGNPRIARTVKLTEGAEFRFYLKYHGDNGNDYTYWSNVRPNDDYEGTSTLFYGTPEGSNTQVMVIGFEDMWEQGSFLNIAPDYDFNDIIIFIEGNLPEPSSKRFFHFGGRGFPCFSYQSAAMADAIQLWNPALKSLSCLFASIVVSFQLRRGGIEPFVECRLPSVLPAPHVLRGLYRRAFRSVAVSRRRGEGGFEKVYVCLADGLA